MQVFVWWKKDIQALTNVNNEESLLTPNMPWDLVLPIALFLSVACQVGTEFSAQIP